jgi:hypothetical protein
VEGSLAFNAPVLTATTSQANLTTSSLSTQMKDEDWVDLSIEGDVSTFNLWETLLRSMGLPQGVQINSGGSSITFDVSDTLSSGEPVPSAGTIAGNPAISWSEDNGWSVQYTVSNSPITTLNWTGDQWQGDFTANYSASKLNSLLGTPLSVIREAKTTYSYNLFNTDLRSPSRHQPEPQPGASDDAGNADLHRIVGKRPQPHCYLHERGGGWRVGERSPLRHLNQCAPQRRC